jgi:hypothetical protein
VEGGHVHDLVLAVDVEVVPGFVVDAAPEAALDEGNQFIGVGKACERQNVVAAPGQQFVDGGDHVRQLFPDHLLISGVFAEEEVER